ncbi:MAG: protein-disulfide reductase DsbD domain-containing protein [Caulobacteraceae bacterium]
MGIGLAAVALHGAAFAQPSLGSSNTVSWTASAPAQSVKPGGKVKVTLRGAVQDGWHVYGLQQLPDGPTPLRVTLDISDIATADGQPSGSPVTKLLDPSFNLQTQFYEHDFTVTAPVRISPKAAAGQQMIPVNVRFQTCNGGICQPPKTVKLSVPVNIQANG